MENLTKRTIGWNSENAEQLGEQLAQCLLEQGAGELVKSVY